MSPESPPIFDLDGFAAVARPSRYLGGEIHAVRKDPSRVEVSIALAFPDVYEVGMSHLGLKILYGILNAQEWLAAERVFCPWVDMEAWLRERGRPLTTLESGRSLSQFDLVGFSLQHELCYTNVLTMLDLAGIPLLARDRSEEHPLVIAGGPACFNPEPMADFFDLMVIGDGEVVALEICRAVRRARRPPRLSKQDLLAGLRHVRGVYIPSHFRVAYGPDGSVERMAPLYEDCREVKKAVVPDIDTYPFPERQVVPFAELVHDRVSVEISRGCTRGCRFCQAGMIYRPVRERSIPSILDKAEKVLHWSGYEDLSLLSLSSGDYTSIGPLLTCLMDRLAPRQIGLSLPSLRVDSLEPEMMEQIKRVRKTGFTLAPEAGNERLRRVINKGLTQEDILKTAQAVYRAGWQLIKLYFMVGLPYEEEQDLLDIVDLSREVVRLAGGKGKRERLNISISTFVPKAHTPFMWVGQIPLEESRRRIHRIQQALRQGPGHRGIRVKWNQPELSWLEGIFSRGDRRLGPVVLLAWRLGARFDAWTEQFQKGVWDTAFARSGVNPGVYLHRQRSLEETLPWEHIASGVSKAFLKSEWHRAGLTVLTPDCRERCLECGVCNHKDLDPVLHPISEEKPPSPSPVVPSPPGPPVTYRLTFTKLGRARYLSHLELSRVMVRAFRRAGLHLVSSKGYHPMPRVSFFSALPVGTESMGEVMEVEFLDRLDPSSLKERINRELPEGVEITRVAQRSGVERRVRIVETHYLITLPHGSCNEDRLARFLGSHSFPIVKTGKKGEHELDARALVQDIALVAPDKIRLSLREEEGPSLKPAEIIKGIFGLTGEDLLGARVKKTGQTLA